MSLPLHHLSGPKAWPTQRLPADQAILRGRVHEFCGPARVALAALVLEHSDGPVIWAYPGWLPERIYPDGLCSFADPGRLILCRARRPEDLLWAMEEALRSGAAPIVLCELPKPPALTPVRRLHLAAESGAERARHHGRLPPLGLLLTPESGGAQGIESRWHMAATPSGSTLLETQARWRMTRTRARMAPPAAWDVLRDDKGHTTASPA